MKNILITGGAGFIGSHVVRLFVNKYPDYHIVNLDKLTYAGNLENLKDIENSSNYEFVRGDIVDGGFIQKLFEKYRFDGVIHLAAESHVDRSISNPTEFIFTNIVGTVNLLNAAKFIIFRRMRFTAHLVKQGFLPKQLHMTRTVRIRLQKQALTTLSEHITIHTDYRL